MKTPLLLLFVVILPALMLLSACGTAQSEVQATTEIVRHIVVFKYVDDATDEQIQRVNEEFAALQDRIPGIVDFEYGINNSPEGLDQGFTHVYLMTFEDVEARDAYLPHPEHEAFVEMLGEMDILDEVFVVDYVPEG